MRAQLLEMQSLVVGMVPALTDTAAELCSCIKILLRKESSPEG